MSRVWRDPSAPVAVGVLTAFLIHAAVDWDWDILLTSIALAAAAVLLVLDPVRSGAGADDGAGASSGVEPSVSRSSSPSSRMSATGLPETRSTHLPSTIPGKQPARPSVRRTWMPWSSEGDQLLGEALAEAGDDRAARVPLLRAARRDPGEWSIWYDLASVQTGPEGGERSLWRGNLTR